MYVYNGEREREKSLRERKKEREESLYARGEIGKSERDCVYAKSRQNYNKLISKMVKTRFPQSTLLPSLILITPLFYYRRILPDSK